MNTCDETPCKLGQDEEFVDAGEVVTAGEIAENMVFEKSSEDLAHDDNAATHENATPEKVDLSCEAVDVKTFVPSPEPEPLMESPLLEKPPQKQETHNDRTNRGQAALQVAKTLFQELVFGNETRKRDLQKEPSEVTEMLRNRKSARFSNMA